MPAERAAETGAPTSRESRGNPCPAAGRRGTCSCASLAARAERMRETGPPPLGVRGTWAGVRGSHTHCTPTPLCPPGASGSWGVCMALDRMQPMGLQPLQEPWESYAARQVFLEVFLEEAALSKDRPGGGPRANVSSAAQGESECGGKRVWALGCRPAAHRQVLEARTRMLAFTHRHRAVRQYSSRYPMCEAFKPSQAWAPSLPGLPEGSRINKSLGGGTRSPTRQPHCLPRRE